MFILYVFDDALGAWCWYSLPDYVNTNWEVLPNESYWMVPGTIDPME